MYTLIYEKRVFKDFDKIPDKLLLKIDQAIQALKQNPLPIGSKKLVGESKLYRVRQGDYRIIYSVDHKVNQVRILVVRHRKEVYR